VAGRGNLFPLVTLAEKGLVSAGMAFDGSDLEARRDHTRTV
jgi:hypothetical protein